MRSLGQFSTCYFFYDKITNTESTKKHQKALKNTTNLRFIRLRKHLSGKKNFFTIRLQIQKILKSIKKHNQFKIYQFKIYQHKIYQFKIH